MRVIWAALAILGAALAVYAARHVLLAAFLAAVFANFIWNVSCWASNTLSVPRVLVAATALILIVAAVGGVAWLGANAIAEQADEFSRNVSRAIDDADHWLQDRSWGESLLEANGDGGFARRVLAEVGAVARRFVESFGAILVFLAVTAYGTIDPLPYRKGVTWLVPRELEERAHYIVDRISIGLFWWLIGRSASMLVVGVLTWTGLWLLGIPASLVLGIIAGMLSFVPNLGPILALVPAVLVAFTLGPWSVLWVILLYIGVQLAETNLITPMIQRQAISLPPALLIVFQLTMGVFAGVWGMLAATPLLVVIMLLVQILYVRDHLNKDVPIIAHQHTT